MLFGLVVRSFGIVYVILLEKFATTATLASSVGAVNIVTWGFFGRFFNVLRHVSFSVLNFVCCAVRVNQA